MSLPGPIFLFVRKMFFEFVEALVPETLVFIGPVDHLTQRIPAQRNENFAALLPALNQTCPLQQLQVLRHRVQGGIIRQCQVRKSGGPVGQLTDYGSAGGVRNGCKNITQMIHAFITP